MAPQVAAALRSPLYLPYISALSPRWPLPSDLGLVYVDDTAWDASTTEQMAARLSEKGLDMLVQNAINGLNVMPPRGGNPSLTDEQIRASVEYMVE